MKNKKKPQEAKKLKYERLYLGIAYFIHFFLIIAIITSFLTRNWLNLFISAITLFLVFTPKIFSKKTRIVLPLEFETIILMLVYAGIFLGEVREFYFRFWWWDSLLHFLSGIALGFAGFLILYILYKTERFDASPVWIAVFSFCFAMTIAVVWEIFEFGMDSFFGWDMQRARFDLEIIKEYGSRIAIFDTMWDLILGATGAFIAAASGYFYIAKGYSPLFKNAVEKFESKNIELFNALKKSKKD